MDSQPGTIWGREPAMVFARVQAVLALVVAFAPDQIGAILSVQTTAFMPERLRLAQPRAGPRAASQPRRRRRALP